MVAGLASTPVPESIEIFYAQDFGYISIDVDLLASSNISDAVLGRVVVAVLQASSLCPYTSGSFMQQSKP